MNARITEIVNAETTKIQQLILPGLTRKEIAGLITNGNYGFVQNVYTKMLHKGRLNQAAITTAIAEKTMMPKLFDKDFGVEFEAYSADKTVLRNRLTEAGIQCEIEGYSHSTRSHWKIVHDSSITSNQPFELVSPILNGEAGLAELMTVCNVLNRCKARVNKTCGTHVHINAREFTHEQWKRIYINCARLKKVIDGFMPESRRDDANRYCKDFGNAANLREIESLLLNSRYWKVNPQSYSRHKTCEFRQHTGTVDFVKISS